MAKTGATIAALIISIAMLGAVCMQIRRRNQSA